MGITQGLQPASLQPRGQLLSSFHYHLYAGAIGPSIIHVALFCLFIFFLSICRPQGVPALPPEARPKIDWKLLRQILWGIIPSIALIFLVLGTILMGLATPTEGGAMGSVGGINSCRHE